MAQWINRLRNKIFVSPPPLPLLCEISGALHLAQPGLTAGWPSGRRNTDIDECFELYEKSEMLVNGASNDDSCIRKMSYIVKRSQGKSSFGATNFKKRVFVLTDSKLTYYDGTLEKLGSQKGVVDLRKVKVIEKVDDHTFDHPSFQIMHGDLILYVICNNKDEQEEWIASIQDLVKDADILQGHYHPGTFTNNRWSCCEHRSKYLQGCKETFIAPSRSLSPHGPLISSLPTSPLSNNSRSLSPNRDPGRLDLPRDFNLPQSQFNGIPAVPSHRNKALPPIPSQLGPLPPPPVQRQPMVPSHKKNTYIANNHPPLPDPPQPVVPIPPKKPQHKRAYEQSPQPVPTPAKVPPPPPDDISNTNMTLDFESLQQISSDPVLQSTTTKDHPKLTCDGYKVLEQTSLVLQSTTTKDHPNLTCDGYKVLEQTSLVLQSTTTKDHPNLTCDGYKVLEQTSPVFQSTTTKDHPKLTCDGYKVLEQVSPVLQSTTTKDHPNLTCDGYKVLEQTSPVLQSTTTNDHPKLDYKVLEENLESGTQNIELIVAKCDIMSEKSTATTDSSNYYLSVENRPTIKDSSNVVYKNTVVSDYEAPSDYKDDKEFNGVSPSLDSMGKNHSRLAGNDYEAILHHSEYASAVYVYSNTMRESTAYNDSIASEYSEVANPDDATVNDAEDIYSDPGHSEADIYACFERKKFHMIKRRDVSILQKLGSGEFGVVNLGLWSNDSTDPVQVAVKTLNSESDRVKFLREAAIMGQFVHNNVVQLHGVVTEEENMMIVLEYMSKGDLREFLINLEDTTAPETFNELKHDLLSYCRHVSAGLSHLASKGFVHRDLAARNILVSSDEVCKIADFGMARDVIDDIYYVSSGGKVPVKWTAPEYINKITTGYRLPPPPGCPRAIYELMIQCWHPEAKLRINSYLISKALLKSDRALLPGTISAKDNEELSTTLGDFLDTSSHLYQDLQNTYLPVNNI